MLHWSLWTTDRSDFHAHVMRLNWLITGHRLAVLSNGALKFSRVTLGDAGTYQCLAKNDAGVAVGRTKLVLQGNEDFDLTDEKKIVSVFVPDGWKFASILNIYKQMYSCSPHLFQSRPCWASLALSTRQCSASQSAWSVWLMGSPILKSLGRKRGGRWLKVLIFASLPMEPWLLLLPSEVTQACTHALPKTSPAEPATTWGWLFKVS